MGLRRLATCFAVLPALLAGTAGAAPPPADEAGFSYCSFSNGTQSTSQIYYVTRIMPQRIFRTMLSYGRDQGYDGPNQNSDVRDRLMKDANRFLRMDLGTAWADCSSSPAERVVRDERDRLIRKLLADPGGRKVFEFDWDINGRAIGDVRVPELSPPPQPAPTQAVAPSGPALIVSVPTEAETRAENARLDALHAMQVAADRQARDREAQTLQRFAAEKSAFEAWKQNRPRPEPCGGLGQRACKVSQE